jgi:hypothetical protein
MKKTIGLLIAIIGISMAAYSFVFTKVHTLNPADSVNGIDANAPLMFSGLIVFGLGLVIYMSTWQQKGQRLS